MLDSLELEVWAVVNCPTWVLETKLGSSGRAGMLVTAEPSLWPHRGFDFKLSFKLLASVSLKQITN